MTENKEHKNITLIIPNKTTEITEKLINNLCKEKNIQIEDFKEVLIPDSVKSIGSFAFRNCTNLTSVAIPDSVICIKEKTFYNCTNLSYIKLECDVSAISDINVFDYCPEDMQIELNDGSIISLKELEELLSELNKNQDDFER